MGFFNKKSIKKSIGYYISEIIVVVIGIYLAIQLNNWNENRKSSIEGKKSVDRILTDLETEKYILNIYLKRIKKSRSSLIDIIYKSKSENLDSLYFYLDDPFIHYPTNSEYINLKSSGKLNLISNDTLRYGLVRHYEVNYAFYQDISEKHKKRINDDVIEYFKTEIPTDTTYFVNANIVASKLNDKKLNNIIVEQIKFYGELSKNIRISRVENLIEYIEKSQAKNN